MLFDAEIFVLSQSCGALCVSWAAMIWHSKHTNSASRSSQGAGEDGQPPSLSTARRGAQMCFAGWVCTHASPGAPPSAGQWRHRATGAKQTVTASVCDGLRSVLDVYTFFPPCLAEVGSCIDLLSWNGARQKWFFWILKNSASFKQPFPLREPDTVKLCLSLRILFGPLSFLLAS